MSIFTGSITFNGKEASKASILPAFQKPLFKSIMTVVDGIKAKQQVAYVGRLSKVTKAGQGCGTQTATNKSGIPLSEKFWDPKKAEIYIELCATDFENKFFVWGLAKGIDRADLEKATAGEDGDRLIDDFMTELVEDAVYEDAMRMVWFNDTDITDITASPAGTLSSALDTPYYNLFDGLWKQIFAAVAAGTTPRYTISENSGATKTAQVLADNKSLTIFKALLNNADPRIANQPDGVILCDKDMFDNWIDYREGKSLESASKDEAMGISVAQFRGIPVIPMNIWSQYIKADFDNGTTYDKPSRAIYTTLTAIQAGFDIVPGDAGTLETWYDRDTKYNKIRGAYMVDAKTGFDQLISVAY